MIAESVLAASLGVLGYAYAGYPALCVLRARLRPRPIRRRHDYRPTTSILIAAWREARTIGAKLESLAAQDYPADKIEVIVACDGSDDGTAEVARTVGERVLPGRCRVIELPARRGKPSALNAAAAVATGEIFVLTDARQRLSLNAVSALVAALGDEEVGAVGGELVLDGDAPAGLYWRYEALLRRLEGTYGSTVGVSGALYAIRPELWLPLPDDTILDDLLQPMRVRLAGKRVAFEPAAQAFDTAAPSGREFWRKVRTLSGNLQLLVIEPRILLPFVNPSWFDFVSHKLFRLAAPFALVGAAAATPLTLPPIALLAGGAQLAGYGLAASRLLGLRLPLGGAAEAFVVPHAAALVGVLRFLRHGRKLPW